MANKFEKMLCSDSSPGNSQCMCGISKSKTLRNLLTFTEFLKLT